MNSTAPLFSTQVAFQCDAGTEIRGRLSAEASVFEYTCLYLQLPAGVALMLVAVSISVDVTAIVFTIIGLLMGLLIMYLFMHKKNVYLPTKEQANLGPIPLHQLVLFMRRCHPKRDWTKHKPSVWTSRTVKLLLMFINVLHTYDYFINVYALISRCYIVAMYFICHNALTAKS